MTTPLIREYIKKVLDRGIDPTLVTWFDLSAIDQQTVLGSSTQMIDLLKTCKPPFYDCAVVFRGRTKSHEAYDVLLVVAGDDLEEGIFLIMEKSPYGMPARRLPPTRYFIKDGMVKYSPMQGDNKLATEESEAMFGFLTMWYRSLLSNCEAYIPTEQNKAINARRIAKGKKPLYDWRTVIVSPKKSQAESLGGTHASPRLHDRRGHLRKYRSGKTGWVKPCKVGNSEIGTVFHDYEVRTA